MNGTIKEIKELRQLLDDVMQKGIFSSGHK